MCKKCAILNKIADKLPPAGENLKDCIIRLSPLAEAKALEQISKKAEDEGKTFKDYYFRVGVLGGGCNGFQYLIEITDKIKETDSIYTHNRLSIIVAQMSEPYIKGLGLDYIDTVMEQRYQFTNPNASGSCGCGTSFSV